MIKINNDFYIDSDAYQYILQQKKVNQKTNEEYYSTVAYLDSVEKCVEAVARIERRKVCQKDLSLVGALHEFEKINKELREILEVIRKDEKLWQKIK